MLPLSIQGAACRGLAVKEWNHGVGVAPIGVFWYFKMAWATLSLSKEPWGPAFPFTILFVVFTTSSARPLYWGYAMEDSQCLTLHVLRNSWNVLEVKGGLLSVLSSSRAPYVWNSC